MEIKEHQEKGKMKGKQQVINMYICVKLMIKYQVSYSIVSVYTLLHDVMLFGTLFLKHI